jgi:hypothetical protein
MELKHLVGLALLDAVDFYSDSNEAQVCRFRLGGIVYVAKEDAEDGYRSMMSELFISKDPDMKNVFPERLVYCKMEHGYNDILNIYDTETNRLILCVGTSNFDDWYPCFVAHFDPTAMSE